MKKVWLVALMSVALMPLLATRAFAATTMCGANQSMTIQNGEFILWNFGGNSHCITYNSGTNWYVSSNATSGEGGQYPCLIKGCHWGTWCSSNSGMPVQISSVSSAPSSWTISGTGASGNWNASYDVWTATSGNIAPNGCELMIWLYAKGTHRPAGSQVATVTIDGISWQYWYSQFSNWKYIAYVANPYRTSCNINIKNFLNDMRNRGVSSDSHYLQAIEVGFEIEDTGGVGLTTNSFSASVSTSGGGGGGNVTPALGTWYRVLARHSGKALDVNGASTADGANVLQWSYGGGYNQQWRLVDVGSSRRRVEVRHSSKALTVYNNGNSDGANVEQRAYSGATGQQWTLTATSSGYYRLTPYCATSRALDVNGNSTADGANVQIWAYGGGNNQQWGFQNP